MSTKRPAPLPPPVLSEDLLDAPRRTDRVDITWFRRPTRPSPREAEGTE